MNPSETNNSQNSTYSYTPPTQPTVIHNKKSQSGWPKILISCSILLVLFLCACVAPILFLTTLSASISSISTSGYTNIEEREIYTVNHSKDSRSKIAVININGAISYTLPGESNSSSGSSTAIIDQIRKAKQDTGVHAVVLRLNTPGGEVSAAEPICRELKELSKDIISTIW